MIGGDCVNVDKFTQQVEKVRQRSETLKQSFGQSPLLEQNLLAQTIEELGNALEELHVAEEELRLQNEQLVLAHGLVEQERRRYQELFDFAPDAYLVTDNNSKIVEANCAAANLLKVPQNLLQGKLLINFIPLEERHAFRFLLLQLCEIEEMLEREITLKPRKGNNINSSISVTTIRDNQGNPLGWRWLVRDITARKQAEEQLRLIQLENLQLQEAARIKTQFMGVVSHELRTPMNTILGFSQILLRRYYNLFPPEMRSMVERIIHSGRQLLAVIENILEFSHLEAGKLELKPEEFNLVELVTKTTEELRFLARQKNLTLVMHAEIENPKVVNDRTRVHQVLVNLLDNAIKFTETGGVIVEVQQINQNRIAIMIKDTGIGIPQEQLKNIFQEFWQLNQTTTRPYGGTGLGLAIVDKLVRLMNGTITVETLLGEGTTFRVELPRNVNG